MKQTEQKIFVKDVIKKSYVLSEAQLLSHSNIMVGPGKEKIPVIAQLQPNIRQFLLLSMNESIKVTTEFKSQPKDEPS